MLDKKEEIPSPFDWGNTNEKFVDEVMALAKKYGLDQVFIAYSEPLDSGEESWHGWSNMMSEGMADYLEEGALPYIREILED